MSDRSAEIITPKIIASVSLAAVGEAAKHASELYSNVAKRLLARTR